MKWFQSIWIKGMYVGYLKIDHGISVNNQLVTTSVYGFGHVFFFNLFFSQLQMWTRRPWQSWWSQALTMCVIKNSDLGITRRHWAMRPTDWFTGAMVPPGSSTCSCRLIRWTTLCSYTRLFAWSDLIAELVFSRFLSRSRPSNQNPRLGT